MICRNCKTINPDGANFCRLCGSRLRIKCPVCAEYIDKSDNYCPYCGEYVKKGVSDEDEKAGVIPDKKEEFPDGLPPFISNDFKTDGTSFKIASFVAYLGLPATLIIALIAACLNVWLIKRHDILGIVNLVDYFSVVIFGYMATKGLKSFRKYSFNSLIVCYLLSIVANAFRFVYAMDPANPYDVRSWPVLSILKFVICLALLIYFLRRRQYWKR